MVRQLTRTAVAALLTLSSVAFAQQANVPNATMTFNLQNHAAGGTGPIAAGIVPGGAFVVRISGLPFSRVLVAASTITAPGLPIPPYGLLDISFPFNVLLDGFVPLSLFDLFARTDSTGLFQLAGSLDPAFSAPTLGLQAAVEDPTAPGGGRLTSAVGITLMPLGTITTTFPQTQLGDDVTVTYFHQALSFPFYGSAYGRTNIDTNGYIAFGNPVDSQWLTAIAPFSAGPPRIAPYWSDLHMSSTVQSAFGFVSVAPASIVVTEANLGGIITLQIDWLAATEATLPPGTGMGTPGNRCDFRVTLDALGTINFRYGSGLGAGMQMPGSGQINTIVGITPGGNLGMNMTSRDLVVGGAVSPFLAASPFDSIFEYLPAAPPFSVDFIGPPNGVSFQPSSLTPPLNTIYQLF